MSEGRDTIRLAAAQPPVKRDGLYMPPRDKLVMAGPGDRTPVMPRIPIEKLIEMMRPAQPPPGVLPKGKKLAFDEIGSDFGGWLSAASSNWAWIEGYTFLGYPYLAQLANIAEYRLLAKTVAEEATRKWGEVKSKSGSKAQAGRIDELTKELKRLGAKAAFCRTSENDSYYGRAHLYLDTGDTDDPKELRKTLGDGVNKLTATKLWPTGQRKGKRGRLRALKTVEPVWCYPARYDAADPLKDNWYRPDTWFVNGKETHCTRLLPFVGQPVSDLFKPAFSFGGLSLSQIAKPYIDNWLQTRQSVNNLIQNFSLLVLSTDLNALLQTGGEQLKTRVDLFNSYRNNQSIFAVSKNDEDLKNVAAPLGSLDKLQAQAQEHICSVGQVPLVKYTGISPSGLNATGDNELRCFYDREHAYQETFFGTNFETVFRIAQINVWGEVDEDLYWEWSPLFELTELQQAELREREAKASQTYVDAGILDPSEPRKAIADDPGSPYGDIDPEDVPEPVEPEPGNIKERLEETGGAAIKGSAKEGDD